jgi:hypothetical protein
MAQNSSQVQGAGNGGTMAVRFKPVWLTMLFVLPWCTGAAAQ